MRIEFVAAGIAAAAVIIVLSVFWDDWFGAVKPPPPPVSAPVEPTPEPVSEPPPVPESEVAQPPALVLPALDVSDEFVLQELAQFALPAAWLDREDLLRRLAVLIDNAPRGEYPKAQLGFLAPVGEFSVIEDGESFLLDPVSYQRYDGYLDVLEAIDPQLLASTLLLFEPLLTQALAELGNSQPIVEQLLAGIAHLRVVRPPVGDVQLVQPKVLYEYADPVLEAMSPLQKQVLRMGPNNIERLHAYLDELQAQLRLASQTDGAS